MESQSWWWSRSCASDRLIPWIGAFWYRRIAQVTLSFSKEPWGSVFQFTILFVIFTMSSVQPLDWEYATEDSLCFIHDVWRNCWWNMLEVDSGQLSVLSSSGVPYAWNSCWQMDINLDVIVWHGFRRYKVSQLVSLSAQARYIMCPTWNMSITICRNGHSGDGGHSEFYFILHIRAVTSTKFQYNWQYLTSLWTARFSFFILDGLSDFFTLLATTYFYYVPDLILLLLYIDQNCLTNSFSHHCGHIPSGHLQFLRYFSMTASILL